MLIALALSPSAKITIVLMAGIVVFPLTSWYLELLKKHHRRVRKRLYWEAVEAHESVLVGLREMAEVFTDLPEHPLELSRQGVQLLDAQARAADSFNKLCRKYAMMSRERKLRLLTREWWKFNDQEKLFSDFRRRVLCAVSDQARRGIVPPPAPGRGYRAIFTVLHHDLPEQLWSAMNETLSNGVELYMQDVDDEWYPVALRFTGGGRAAFSRKFLERAVALKMIIGHVDAKQEVFEYSVSHTLPVKPMRGIKGRLGKLLASRLNGAILSSK